MTKKFLVLIISIAFFAGIFLFWSSLIKNDIGGSDENAITVFKSLTCGCCGDYVDYLKREGFKVRVENVSNMLSIKEKYKIPQDLESCHTAIVDGYFIEGHVPIEAIKKLISEKPDILGIALPGMPQGSPGMGGVKKEAFKIYGLSKAGEILEFMSI